MKKFTAFTLAEVMITVGILGVVAAMTIPTLVKNYQEDAMVVRFRKVVNDFENAADMYLTQEGKTSLAHTALFKNDDGISTFMSDKFLKATAYNGNESPFADNYARLRDMKTLAFSCSGNEYLLPNSAAVCLTKENGEIKVLVDTNGKAKPNIGGRDMFAFYIFPNATVNPYSKQGVTNGGDAACEQCLKDHGCPGEDGSTAACPEATNTCMSSTPSCTSKQRCSDYQMGYGCYNQLLENNWKMNY